MYLNSHVVFVLEHDDFNAVNVQLVLSPLSF